MKQKTNQKNKNLLRHLALNILIFLSLNANAINSANAANATNAENLTEQKFTVANNGEIQAFASKAEITRLAFESSVIEIHALSEELEYAINGKDIYLRVLSEKPINFFVKTEDEMTYKIILLASDIASTQVFIHKMAAYNLKNTQTEYFNQVSPELKNRIAKIIEVTLSPTKYLGYNIAPKYLNLISPVKNLNMRLIGNVTGTMLVAEKISLTNPTDKSQKLNMKDFMGSEYLAVYLSKDELLPKEKGLLIRILEN